MTRYNRPRRTPKPRPVHEIEADLARLEAANKERPKDYNAAHYNNRELNRRAYADLRSELIRARTYYGNMAKRDTE